MGNNKNKRYIICMFPSLRGTPIKTNYLVVAYIIASFRFLFGGEIRVIDKKTGNHIIVW